MFTSDGGSDVLYSNWSTSNRGSFITNEEWIANADSKTWVETGDVAGSINGNYYKGPFVARQSTAGYAEYAVNDGAHMDVDYEIHRVNGSWVVMVNGAQIESFNMGSTFTPTVMQVGIESNDNENYFDFPSATDEYLYYYDQNDNTKNWSIANVINNDDNNLNWWSAYASFDNMIGFYIGSSDIASLSSTFNPLSQSRTKTVNQSALRYYKVNNSKQDNYLSVNSILKKVKSTQISTSTSKITSIVRKTWQEHVKDYEKDNVSKIFDPNHEVTVVTTSYPDGLNTKAGFYKNATLTTVYDAVTGDLLESSVTGNNSK